MDGRDSEVTNGLRQDSIPGFEPVCRTCGSTTESGRITFIEGECYSCAKSFVSFGKVPVSPDGTSIREMRERHKEWGRGNLGVDIVDADRDEMIDRAIS